MKIVIGAAFAAVLLAGAAFAQTGAAPAAPAAVAADSACPGIGAEPTLPDPRTASNREFQAGQAAYQAWGTSVRAALECRRLEIARMEARSRALLEEHNAGAARLNAFTTSWVSATNVYCAREGVQCAPE